MRKVINIGTDWKFIKENVKDSVLPISLLKSWENVDIPHSVSMLDVNIDKVNHMRTICSYEKVLYIDVKQDEDVYLEFSGINASATIYVNGSEAGSHEGGCSLFRINITPFLLGHRVKILVIANNSRYAQMSDSTSFCGIYRDVNIIMVQKSHFALSYFGSSGLMATPYVNDDGSADVSVTAYSENTSECKVHLIIDGADTVVNATAAEHTFHIEKPHFWNGTVDPFLYTVKAELIKNGYVIDVVEQSFGIRSFYIDGESGFVLNNQPYLLCDDFSDEEKQMQFGSVKESEEHIKLMIEKGINAITLSHYNYSQDFYNLCDKYGIIVFDEISLVSAMMRGERSKENALKVARELIFQNYNHPSIICWKISNKTSRVNRAKLSEYLKELNDLFHRLDKSRFINVN